MDISILETLVHKARERGTNFYPAPEWARGTLVEDWFWETMDVDDNGALIEILREQPDLKMYDNQRHNRANSSYTMTLERLLKWLLYYGNKIGADETYRRLERYASIDYLPIWEVVVITGIRVEKVIDLGNGIQLAPISALPEHQLKYHLDPSLLSREVRMHLDIKPMMEAHWEYPTLSVLMRHMEYRPRIGEGKRYTKSNDDLVQASELLTLVKDVAPVPVSHTYLQEDWVPCTSLVSYTLGGMNTYELVNIRQYDQELETELQAVKTYALMFRALDKSVHDRLRICLQRLNNAKRRRGIENTALELGIAFEILYLSDAGHREQLSFTLRLRAAWHLGKNKSERTHYIKLFRAIYDLRSTVVHNGFIDARKPIKVQEKVYPLTQLLHDAKELCSEGILKIIKYGKFPDWESMVLGE